jgi:transcriptional regulator with AAA-type ATPase domain
MTDSPRYRYILAVLSEDPVPVRRIYLKPGEYVVGSQSGCDVHLPVAGVSRRHASIEILDDGGAVVSDLRSKNGTFLGGKRIKRGAVPGTAAVAFGSVRAELVPVSPSSGHLLIEADEALAGILAEPATEQANQSPTAETSMVEHLVRALNDVLCAAEQRRERADTCVVQIAHRWAVLLNPERLELGRSAAAGEVVLAVVGSQSRPPDTPPRLEVSVPSGWWLRLWKDSGRSLARLQPVLEVALRALSPGAGPGDGSASPVPLVSPEAELPAPGSLSSEMRGLYRRAAKVAQGEIPVVILGESGTGKEVLARWIHQHSPRSDRIFLSFNCAAMPRDLLEAELFGIEKGVATGVDRRPGILEQADGGTILLDEIGDMALETQAKLLRVLEGKRFYRVGGRTEITVDVRFFAATNRPLDELVESGAFRRDLFHRLAAFVVSLPPLSARREDIPLLASYFFQRECAHSDRKSPGITRAALGALVDYSWPGNIRQLENEIAKAVLLLESGEPLDLPHLSRAIRDIGKSEQPALSLSLATAVADAERLAFRLALAAAAGDAAGAIAILGISRATYYRKLKELGIA